MRCGIRAALTTGQVVAMKLHLLESRRSTADILRINATWAFQHQRGLRFSDSQQLLLCGMAPRELEANYGATPAALAQVGMFVNTVAGAGPSSQQPAPPSPGQAPLPGSQPGLAHLLLSDKVLMANFMLIFVLRQTKTSTGGDRQELGVMRHKFALLCPIGSLGLSMLWDIAHCNRKWDLNEYTQGEVSYPLWFEQRALSAVDNPRAPYMYSTNATATRQALKHVDASGGKTTHIWRGSLAISLQLLGFPSDVIRSMGLWDLSRMERHYTTKVHMYVDACSL